MHLKTIDVVRCSILKLAEYWPWDDAPPTGTRFQGCMTRWASKDECRLYVKWDNRKSGTAECLVDPKDGTSLLLDPRFQFRSEQYEDARPAPTPPLVAGPFLLAQHNYSTTSKMLRSWKHALLPLWLQLLHITTVASMSLAVINLLAWRRPSSWTPYLPRGPPLLRPMLTL